MRSARTCLLGCVLVAAVASTGAVAVRGKGVCPPGWLAFTNKDRSEDSKSCLKLIQASPVAAGFDAACNAEQEGAQAATFKSDEDYRKGRRRMISRIIDGLLVPTGTSFAAVGCAQAVDSATGAGKSGQGWAWFDGTPANNLACPDSRKKCSELWGSMNYQVSLNDDASQDGYVDGNGHVLIREPTDGGTYGSTEALAESIAYDEQHFKDVCVVRPSGRFGNNGLVKGGLFAASLASLVTSAALVPLVCELPDADNDGVFDDEDVCAGTVDKREVNSVGCDRAQADGDRDRVCNAGMPASSFCKGTDNCPSTQNRNQTATDAESTLGDACNLNGCHESCKHGCDPTVAGKSASRRGEARFCTTPYANRQHDDSQRCLGLYKPRKGHSHTGCYCPEDLNCDLPPVRL